MSNQDYRGIFVFVEQVDHNISGVSFELLGKAKQLAQELKTQVTAVLLGNHVDELAGQLAAYGADRVVMVNDPALETYMTEPYVRSLTAVIEHYQPEIVLCGATAIGRDLAPRVSARIHTGLTADCTRLEIQTGTGHLMMTRPAFGGNIMATILCPEYRPQMATVRPGVMQRLHYKEGAVCPINEFAVEHLADSRNVELLEVIKKVRTRTDIMDAGILIAGGRGLGSAEKFQMLEELAELLGGSVAASRAVVDAGWCEKDCQVGQTGKTVRPFLYIACGISGAIQHVTGMEESEIIIAINQDETAPIFDVADYGVVGDVCKIVPRIIQNIRAEIK